MYKRYKIKKRRKIVSPYYIFIIFAIAILFVTSGYAMLSDNLSIVGKANILSSTSKEYGNSTYSWSIFSTWANDSGGITYQVKIPINNFDGDISIWEVSFDLPDGCFASTDTIWQASEVSIFGNTITLKGKEWNGFLANGSTLSLDLILPFETEDIDFTISNLVLNGKYVNFEPET